MHKILLASALTLTFALPIKAQVGPGANSSDIPYGRGGDTIYAQVCTNEPNGRLSLRSGPGQNYRKIKEIRNGDTLALNSSQYDNRGFRWWSVYHNGSRGWVRADYVCGDPE